MRETYNIIKHYLLNGVFAYAIFGIYALTIAPLVNEYIIYNQHNMFIAVFGFVMLIAEFFAFNFKLKMVKIRAQQKRLAYKQETGKDIIPYPSPAVLFGFFMRIVFDFIIFIVCFSAAGFTNITTLTFIIGLPLSFTSLIYTYFNTGVYTDLPQNRNEFAEEIKEENDWDKINLPLANTQSYFWRELISDIVLQIYAYMLFTVIWLYINATGFENIHQSVYHHNNALVAALNLFPMLFSFVIVALMPIRIAYWIEDSMDAFTIKEKVGMWISFILVSIFSCSPSIIKYVSIFILHHNESPYQLSPAYIGNIIIIALFILLLIVQIIVFGKRK